MRSFWTLSVLLCVAGMSWGASYSVTDSYATDDGWEEAGWGGSVSLFVYRQRWAAVQFDLPSAGEAINSVTSATLTTRWTATGGGTIGMVYNIYRMTADFDENMSPWNESMPAHDTSAVVQFNIKDLPTNWGAFVSFDVSSLLANNGDKPTFGVVIRASDWIAGDNISFLSRNYDSGYSTPKLTAAYTTIPEPATLGLLAAGGLLAAWRKRR